MTLHVFQYLTSNSVHLISTPMEPKIWFAWKWWYRSLLNLNDVYHQQDPPLRLQLLSCCNLHLCQGTNLVQLRKKLKSPKLIQNPSCRHIMHHWWAIHRSYCISWPCFLIRAFAPISACSCIFGGISMRWLGNFCRNSSESGWCVSSVDKTKIRYGTYPEFHHRDHISKSLSSTTTRIHSTIKTHRAGILSILLWPQGCNQSGSSWKSADISSSFFLRRK